jgi:predicted acetyltransferase
VAFYIFDQFRGKWEVQETEANVPAQHFWRKNDNGIYLRALSGDQFE